MVDLTISIVATSLFALLAVAYAARSLLVGPVRQRRIEADGGSVFLNKSIKEMVYWVLNPLIDFFAALHIGTSDHHAAIESAGTQQRRVENIGAVGRGD